MFSGVFIVFFFFLNGCHDFFKRFPIGVSIGFS